MGDATFLRRSRSTFSDDVKSTESIDVVNLELSQQLVNTSSTDSQQVKSVEFEGNGQSDCVVTDSEDLAMSQQGQQDGGSQCTNEPIESHAVAYGIEVGGRIIDVLTGFVGIVTQIYDDNVVYFCKEMGTMIRRVHSVVALG